MLEKLQYNRGSEWRKWDLQACTNMYNNYSGLGLSSDDLERMHNLTGLDKSIINSDHKNISHDDFAKIFVEYLTHFTDLDVVAITNHNTGEGIDEILAYLNSKKDNDDSENPYNRLNIFPGVEIGCNDRCHILSIFNIETKVSNKYKHDQDGNIISEKTWAEYISDFLNEIGITEPRFGNGGNVKNATIGVFDVLDMANSWEFIAVFPHICNPDGWWNELQDSTRKRTYAHQAFGIVDTGSLANNQHLKRILDGKISDFDNKCVAQIHTSDANSISEIGSQFTWIKSDPTFEGLRQIIFEPLTRVKLQTDSPYDNQKKLFLDSIAVSGSTNFILDDFSIPLNRELVTVIGGRGTGKSALLETIAFLNEEHLRVDPNGKKKIIEYYRSNEAKSDPKPSFTVKTVLVDKDNNSEDYSKNLDGSENSGLPFVYIGQEQLSKLATNDVELTKTVCDLVGIDTGGHLKQDLVAEGRNLLSKITNEQQKINDIFSKHKDSGLQDDDDFSKWASGYMSRLRKQQERLSSKETKDTLQEINDKSSRMLKMDDVLEKGEQAIIGLENLEINHSIAKFNKGIEELYPGEKNVAVVDPQEQVEKIKEFQEKLRNDKTQLEKDIDARKAELVKQGIKEDINTLMQSATALQREINNIERDIQTFEETSESLKELIIERNGLLLKIKQNLGKEKTAITVAFEKFTQPRNDSEQEEKELFEKIMSGIEISGEIVFDERTLSESLLSFVDGRTIPNETAIRKHIAGENPDGTSKHVTLDSLIEWVNNADSFKVGVTKNGREKILEYIFTQWQDFVWVKAVAKLNDKRVETLSIGQRGTLLLKIYLATSNAKQIFIIDQPEDNLDNDFIMHELVPLIRRAKLSRQIIMSTHNANLVVNADSEQVIVAMLEEDDEDYISGSIENPVINNKIKDILEGGEIAFIQRERKYNLSL